MRRTPRRYKLKNADVVWRWPTVHDNLIEIMEQRILAACEATRSQLVINISQGFTNTDGPSSPFDFPHRQTGRLANSYRVAFDHSGTTMTGFVGSELKYSYYLEVGTSRMLPRPHLIPTFIQMAGTIKRILTKKITRDLSK